MTGIIMAIALVAVVIYHFVNTIPPAGTSKESQAIAIFEDASCMACHGQNIQTPFYAGIPLIGSLLKEEMQKGYHRFNMEDAWNTIKIGEAVNEAHLAKIEMETVILGTMPPKKHYLVHWGASLTPAKQTILKNWFKYHREKFYPNELSAEAFKYEPTRPIPPPPSVNGRKVALGKTLFYDPRLSSDNTLSCASCHNPKTGGANHRQFSESVNKRMGNINTPTVFNASLNTLQSWYGEPVDLETFIAQHITHPTITGHSSMSSIIRKWEKDDDIRKSFDRLYDDGITNATIADAISTFIKTLLTPDCSFDQYLKGDEYAINKKEIFGYELFKSHKCATCHAGANLGGLTRERMGIHKDYFKDRNWELANEDSGRYNQTADAYDLHRFKVSGLRNVAETKPYFHDGSQQSLYDAVQIMGAYQSGRNISDEEIKAIVSFLETLTGKTD